MMKEALDDANDLFSNLDSAIQEAKKDIEDMAEMLDNEAEKRQNELDAIGDKIEHIQNLNEFIIMFRKRFVFQFFIIIFE